MAAARLAAMRRCCSTLSPPERVGLAASLEERNGVATVGVSDSVLAATMASVALAFAGPADGSSAPVAMTKQARKFAARHPISRQAADSAS